VCLHTDPIVLSALLKRLPAYRQSFRSSPDRALNISISALITHLTSIDAPICATDHEELLGALKHETLPLKCEVDSSPPADSFHWTFNSSGEQTELPARLHSSEVGLSEDRHLRTANNPCIFIPISP